jgi:sugar (glycoside-pentoside-hexuronide) transporter
VGRSLISSRLVSELTPAKKAVYAWGDHAVNTSLGALSLVFLFFLTEIAGLDPLYAGAVVWIARVFDAVTDPLMGRISDRTTWRMGRRRPYFFIGLLPFGASFALLWTTPFEGQFAMFGFYALTYMALSLSTTVLSVPYLALIPEMAKGYDERTSLNTFRSGAAVLGTFVAAAMPRFVEALGGGAAGYAAAGSLLGVWLIVPWPAVFAVSYERPEEHNSRQEGSLFQGMRELAQHPSYLRLCGLFLSCRIAVDVVGLSFLFYFTYWLKRPGDFSLTLFCMLAVVVVSLPFWLAIAKRNDKHRLFCFGAAWWVLIQLGMMAVTPEWPRSSIFFLAAFAGIGYAMADLMPWAMVGEVIDEDELRGGVRREGLYNGTFTFVRKAGGATAYLLAGLFLKAAGYVQNSGPGIEQPESALMAIRLLTCFVPAIFLCIAIALAWNYPLSRRRHQEIVAALHARHSQLRPEARSQEGGTG